MLEIQFQFFLRTITSDIHVPQSLWYGVKICLEWDAKIALVILLFDFVLTDHRGRESWLLSGYSLIQNLQYCEF